MARRETVPMTRRACSSATIQKLADYWTSQHDWRKVEARLNSFPNFITSIDGVDIHFIHVRSRHENATAADVTAWLARFGHRTAEDHRAAD
jgi:hypothetical protein